LRAVKMNVLDLFCGAGGFSWGFKKQGFKIVAGIDNFKPCAETFKLNFPEANVILEDIKKVKTSTIKSFKPNIIIGGPPCEPYTPINHKRMKEPLDRLYVDPIGSLVLEFVRFVSDLQPDFFVMENVVQIAEGELKDAIAYEFERVGYKVHFNIIRAEEHGVPSKRARMFISNIKLKLKKERKTNVWQAIGDLPDPREEHSIPNHAYKSIPKRVKRRIHKLRFGKAAVFFGKYSDYVRLHPNKVAPTVRGSSRFIHPFEDRLLTVREHARLMSFPDTFVFTGGFNIQYNQVGEAVPPKVAEKIAEVIKKLMKLG